LLSDCERRNLLLGSAATRGEKKEQLRLASAQFALQLRRENSRRCIELKLSLVTTQVDAEALKIGDEVGGAERSYMPECMFSLIRTCKSVRS
jgi:hypothetical protein